MIGLICLAAYFLATIAGSGDTTKAGLVLLGVLVMLSVGQQQVLVQSFIFAYIFLIDYFAYSPSRLLNIGFNFYLGDAFIILFLGSTFIITIIERNHPAFHSPVGITIVLYVTWILISVVRGIPEYGHSAIGESRFVVIWMCPYFAVIYGIRNLRQAESLMKLFLALSLVYIAYSLIWRMSVDLQGDLEILLRSRLFGADVAVALASIFVFFLSMLISGSVTRHKSIVVGLMVICGLLMPFCARTGWVAMLISTAFVLVAWGGRSRLRNLAFVLFVALTVAGIIIQLGLFGPGSRLDPTSEMGLGFVSTDVLHREGVGTSEWRIEGWMRLIRQTVATDPIFGQAFGGYYDIFDSKFEGVPPHNEWLIIFSKMGVVGLLLFAAVILRFYRAGFQYLRRQSDTLRIGYMRGFLAVFFAALVGGAFFEFLPLLWIAAGLQSVLLDEENLGSKENISPQTGLIE